jgi:ribosomal protein S14
MDVWGWIVVYAVGLTVLQLLVYRYLLNNGGSLTRRVGTPFGDGDRDAPLSNRSSGSNGSARQPGSPSSGEVDPDGGSVPSSVLNSWSSDEAYVPRRPDRDDAAESTGPGHRRCPYCGAENEPDETFALCWNCTRELRNAS